MEGTTEQSSNGLNGALPIGKSFPVPPMQPSKIQTGSSEHPSSQIPTSPPTSNVDNQPAAVTYHYPRRQHHPPKHYCI